MAGQDEMKSDTAITFNWLRFNVPQIVSMVAAVIGVTMYLSNGIRDAARSSEDLKVAVSQIQQTIAPLNNLEYRMTRAESYISEAHSRIDNLSNTMINNIDLIRRDVNRLTTQVEVFSVQLGTLLGEDKTVPIQRRSRPGGPIPVD